jgi:large repetitive protein
MRNARQRTTGMPRRLLLVIGLGGFAIAAACTPVKPPASDTTPPPMPSIDLDLESDGGPPHDDNNTNDTTPTFVGTAEAGAKVRVLDGVTDVAVGTANGSGTYMATTSVLAPGSHDIRAIAVDAANNQSEPSTLLVVTIDTTAPGAPSTPDLLATDDSGLSNTDNVTNNNQPTFTGTKLANHSVQLFSGSTLLGTEAPDGTTSYSIPSGAVMGDGVHSVAAVQLDPAGNISVASGVLSVRIDTVLPIVGVNAVADPTNGTPTLGGPAGTVLGDAATVTVKIYSGTSTSGTLVQTLTPSVGSSAWSTTPSPALANGVYTVQASQSDVAGNTGQSATDTFTVSV